MLNFYHYSEINTNNSSIKNSLITFLPEKRKTLSKNYFKNNNLIRGFYKDKILKDFVYISSSGFKKDYFFRKQQINTNNIQLNTKQFISCFSILDNKLLNFHFYPKKYYNLFLVNYFKKRYFILKYLGKKSKPKIYSCFWSYYTKWNSFKNKSLFFNYNKRLFIKKTYKRLFFINTLGVINKFKIDFFQKMVFTGLIRILSPEIKTFFQKILITYYLILRFCNNLNNTISSNKASLFSLILYTYFYKYNVTKFYKLLKENKIKIRKSNRFLRKYTFFLKRKYIFILNHVTNLVYLQLIKNNIKKNIFNWFLYNKNSNNIFLYNLNNSIFIQELLMSNIEEKIKLLQSITNILNLTQPQQRKTHSYIDQYWNYKFQLQNHNLDNIPFYSKYLFSNFKIKFWIYNFYFNAFKNNCNTNYFFVNNFIKFRNYKNSKRLKFKRIIQNQNFLNIFMYKNLKSIKKKVIKKASFKKFKNIEIKKKLKLIRN